MVFERESKIVTREQHGIKPYASLEVVTLLTQVRLAKAARTLTNRERRLGREENRKGSRQNGGRI